MIRLKKYLKKTSFSHRPLSLFVFVRSVHVVDRLASTVIYLYLSEVSLLSIISVESHDYVQRIILYK